jgi:hypothetical protein
MRAFRQMLSRLKDNFIIFEAWSSDKLLGMVPNLPYLYTGTCSVFFRALLYSHTHFRYRTGTFLPLKLLGRAIPYLISFC